MKGQNQFMEETAPTGYVAIIPAAGAGTRLPNRELSKELMPYAVSDRAEKPVISHLLNCFGQAGVDDTVVVLREDKTDIKNYLLGPEWSGRRSISQ